MESLPLKNSVFPAHEWISFDSIDLKEDEGTSVIVALSKGQVFIATGDLAHLLFHFLSTGKNYGVVTKAAREGRVEKAPILLKKGDWIISNGRFGTEKKVVLSSVRQLNEIATVQNFERLHSSTRFSFLGTVSSVDDHFYPACHYCRSSLKYVSVNADGLYPCQKCRVVCNPTVGVVFTVGIEAEGVHCFAKILNDQAVKLFGEESVVAIQNLGHSGRQQIIGKKMALTVKPYIYKPFEEPQLETEEVIKVF